MKKLTAVVFALILTVACGARTGQVYVEADTATIDAILAVKNAKDVRCDAGQIPASSCEAISKAFVPVFESYLAANRLITAEAPLNEIDVAITNFKAAAFKFRDAVSGIQSEYRNLLLDLLEAAIRSIDARRS